MPRRSLRSSGASVAEASASRTASTPKSRTKKTSTTNQKQLPNRLKNTKRRAEDEQDELVETDLSPPSETDGGSGYEDNTKSSTEESTASGDDGSESEADSRPRKRQRQSKPTTITKTKGVQEELWRPGVKTGLGSGTQVIIEKPRARSPGKTPYRDDTLHPNTLLFLGDLAKNNDREWLKMHDPDYRTTLKDFTSFAERLQQRLVEHDPTVPELPIKDVLFRIYRDVRFSPDQTPYKTHYSAAWSRTGRKGPYAHYYIQIAPGKSFIGGGLWHPETPSLAAMRRDISRKPHKIKDVLVRPDIRKHFLEAVTNDEGKAVKAFAAHNAENALKKRPNGYDANHPEIELLRLRNFTIGRKLSDAEVLQRDALERISSLLGTLTPYITYLNSVVMPDDAEDSSSSDSDDNVDDE